MSTAEVSTQSVAETPAVDDFPAYRITVECYMRMVEAGVFGRGNRVFLWHGGLVEKRTKGRPHSYAVLKLDQLLESMIPANFHLEWGQPIRLNDDTLPEPDVVVVRGSLEDYRRQMPTPRDLALIIEVADSSVSIDRGAVLRTYAAIGIAVYWLVNIPQRRIEVYSDPSGPAETPTYRSRVDHGDTAELPVVLDGREVGRIVVGQILP